MDERKTLTTVREKTRQTIADYTRDERKHKERLWSSYGSDYQNYSNTFGFPPKTLPDFVESVRSKHNPFGLDLLSGTEMLSSLDIGGIAVGLADARSKEQISKDADKRWLITGDLLHERKQVWRSIKQEMALHHIPIFDLITQRGVMGMDLVSPDPTLHFYHLQQMWSVLAEGGMIITEISAFDSSVLEDQNLYDFWSSVKGVQAVPTPWKGLKLIKLPGYPDRLPLNFKPTKKELREWKHTYKAGK